MTLFIMLRCCRPVMLLDFIPIILKSWYVRSGCEDKRRIYSAFDEITACSSCTVWKRDLKKINWKYLLSVKLPGCCLTSSLSMRAHVQNLPQNLTDLGKGIHWNQWMQHSQDICRSDTRSPGHRSVILTNDRRVHWRLHNSTMQEFLLPQTNVCYEFLKNPLSSCTTFFHVRSILPCSSQLFCKQMLNWSTIRIWENQMWAHLKTAGTRAAYIG